MPGLEGTLGNVSGEPVSVRLQETAKSILRRLGADDFALEPESVAPDTVFADMLDEMRPLSGDALVRLISSLEVELYRSERLYEVLCVELVRQSVVMDSVRSRLRTARRQAVDDLSLMGKTEEIFAGRFGRALQAAGVGALQLKSVTPEQIQGICAVLKDGETVEIGVASMIGEATTAVFSSDVPDHVMQELRSNPEESDRALQEPDDVYADDQKFGDSSAVALDHGSGWHQETRRVVDDTALCEDGEASGNAPDYHGLGAAVLGSVGNRGESDEHETQSSGDAVMSEGFVKARQGPPSDDSTLDENAPVTDGVVRSGPLDGTGASVPALDLVRVLAASNGRPDSDPLETVSGDSRPMASSRPDLDLLSVPADLPYVIVEHRMATSSDREAMAVRWPAFEGPRSTWSIASGLRAGRPVDEVERAANAVTERQLPILVQYVQNWAKVEPGEARRLGLMGEDGEVSLLAARIWAMGAGMLTKDGVNVFGKSPVFHGIYLPSRTGRDGWVRQLCGRYPMEGFREPFYLIAGLDGDKAMADPEALADVAARWDANVEAARAAGAVGPEPVML